MTYDTLFIDRDGVINRKIDNGYVLSIDGVELLPDMREFMSWASAVFRQIIVVTNQRCIGRGLVTHTGITQINNYINEQMGNVIAAFFVCPHLSEDECGCRKPKQGLFLAAANDYPVDFKRSWMIGDSESDLIPAKELGISTIYISDKKSEYADVLVRSTRDLKGVFLKIVAGTIGIDATTR